MSQPTIPLATRVAESAEVLGNIKALL